MNKVASQTQRQITTTPLPASGILQRKCACGNQTVAGGECDACNKERLNLQRRAVDNRSEPSEVPPIVHEVLRSPGQPLDPATRAFMEPRFGHDFSQVRVHTDAKAAESARAVNSLAYTVGQDIVFGATRYSPQTGEGRRLIAHELTHVLQQWRISQHNLHGLGVAPKGNAAEQEADHMAKWISGISTTRMSGASHSVYLQAQLCIQRQVAIPKELQQNVQVAIPKELQQSVNLQQLSDLELQARYDLITSTLSQIGQSTSEIALLQDEAGAIGIELGRRRALAEGHIFSEAAIMRMRKYFIQNAKTEKDSCIVALNEGVKLAFGDQKQPTTPESIEKTMEKIQASGRSSDPQVISFEDRKGRVSTSGALFPHKLHESVWATVIAMAAGDPGWSVFTMSLMDGFHSVTLTLDNNIPASPRIYWSDQWKSKRGWKKYTRATLDAEVTQRIQGWWHDQPEGGKHNTIIRLWRLRQ